ncbi:lens fiber membrane intrinsic protein-like [Elysia marginata]|uniref:Lens fiber membrane intrinsic protein-like n=1 Tax=Elysia marginata TaxID=1093978 RepID=A0AAV4FNJ0_9GAST|nr:lens fiber membrane intrinsic protein-like [Elysia marginata]
MAFNLVSLIAFGAVGLGVLLHIIGLATPQWVTKTQFVLELGENVDISQGLWQVCVNGKCNAIPDRVKLDWYKACDAMAILGMLAGMFSALMVGIVFVMSLMNRNSANTTKTTKTASVLSFLAAVASGRVLKNLSKELIFNVPRQRSNPEPPGPRVEFLAHDKVRPRAPWP